MIRLLKELRRLKKENKSLKKQVDIDAYVINRLATKNGRLSEIINALLKEEA